MTVILYPHKIEQLLGAPGHPVYNHFEKITNRVVALAKAQVGVQTGALQSSISGRVTPGRSVTSRVVASDSKAIMHHEGTRPHLIKPKGQTLKFSKGGKVIHTKIVRHPGTKPNRFLTDSLRAVI